MTRTIKPLHSCSQKYQTHHASRQHHTKNTTEEKNDQTQRLPQVTWRKSRTWSNYAHTNFPLINPELQNHPTDSQEHVKWVSVASAQLLKFPNQPFKFRWTLQHLDTHQNQTMNRPTYSREADPCDGWNAKLEHCGAQEIPALLWTCARTLSCWRGLQTKMTSIRFHLHQKKEDRWRKKLRI